MQQQMQSMQTMSFSIGGEQQQQVEIKASVRTEPAELQVGEPFEFILALEAPKTSSIGQIQISPSEMYGLTVTGRPENMTDGVSSNPSNVVKRLSIRESFKRSSSENYRVIEREASKIFQVFGNHTFKFFF